MFPAVQQCRERGQDRKLRDAGVSECVRPREALACVSLRDPLGFQTRHALCVYTLRAKLRRCAGVGEELAVLRVPFQGLVHERCSVRTLLDLECVSVDFDVPARDRRVGRQHDVVIWGDCVVNDLLGHETVQCVQVAGTVAGERARVRG